MFIEFADERRSEERSSLSVNAVFTSFWQSSKVPFTLRARTFPSKVESCFSWSGEIFPSGYKIVTSSPGTLWNALPTAEPVSPDVATRMWRGLSSLRLKYDITRAIKRAPKSLNAHVGPWKSSRTYEFGSRPETFAGKGYASFMSFLRSFSGISPST